MEVVGFDMVAKSTVFKSRETLGQSTCRPPHQTKLPPAHLMAILEICISISSYPGFFGGPVASYLCPGNPISEVGRARQLSRRGGHGPGDHFYCHRNDRIILVEVVGFDMVEKSTEFKSRETPAR